MRIVVLSKTPPGGRCNLYMGYARVLQERAGAMVEIRHVEDSSDPRAPAFLLHDSEIEPSDCWMLSPEDLHGALREQNLEPAALAELHAELQSMFDRFLAGARGG